MLTEAENVVDYVPFYYLFALVPLMLVFSAPGAVATSNTNQYLVYRVHQIDMPHGSFGSKSSIFNLEAITPAHISDSFIRKCALFKFDDLVEHSDKYNKIIQESLVSGILIIFSEADFQVTISGENYTNWHNFEKNLLSNETNLPIYFIKQNNNIDRLYEQYKLKESSDSSIHDFFMKNVFFDSHQLVVSSPQITKVNDAIITNFQAKLIGAGIEDQLPTFAIVAHYDSYSFIPGLSYGADSNASGLVILLELMRIFSKLFSNPKTKPKANLVFFISGGGKLNYFGTKKWLEDNLDSSHSSNNPIFENMQFALCLDSLADSLSNNGLHMHVSKPPKQGSSASLFWNNLEEISKTNYPLINTSMVHKKINLAQDFLSWEHERFSLRRISSFTLSSLSNPQMITRRSIFDVYNSNFINTLEMYTNIIGETLIRQLYGPIKENLLVSEYKVSSSVIKSLFEYIANIPRAQQLLVSSKKGSSYQLPVFLQTIQTIVKEYSNNNIHYHFKVDSKSPEFTFYDPVTTKMNIFNMKPAIFDFVITVFILLYLGAFYLTVKNFQILEGIGGFVNDKCLIKKIK